MKKNILKLLVVIIAAVTVFSTVPFTYAQNEKNIYAGISVASFDDINTQKYSVQSNGAVDISQKGGTLTYKNINFYKDVSHVQLTYATGTFVNQRRIKLMLDDPQNGTEIAYFMLEETGNVNNYRTATCEVTVDIKGKHDVFLIDENGSSARIKALKFLGRWEEGNEGINQYPEEIYILDALNIADYSYVTKEKLNKPITRRDFSKMVSELFKIKDISNSTFYDVNKDDKDIKAMASLHALGAIEAKNGYFYPDSSLTLDEAYKALLIIMGYETKVKTKYNGSYFAQAAELKMDFGISGLKDSELTYTDAVVLVENTLYVTMPLTKYPSLDIVYTASPERTVLSLIHEVKKGKGIVNGNSKSYLSRYTETTSSYQVLIGNTFYNIGSSGVDRYLGYNITFYYKEINGVNTVIAVLPVENSNKTEIIKAEDIVSFSAKKLTYKKNDTDKYITFKNTADVLFNGVSCTDYLDSDFILNEGSVTFIDNDSDGDYEVVSIVSGIDYIVDSVDALNDIISLKQNNTGSSRLSILTSDDKVYNLEIYIKGNRASVSDIKSGDVVTVYDSKLYNGMIMNSIIRVSGEVSEEIIKEKYTSEGKTYIITQSDKEYVLSKNCNTNITVGTSYIIHVNTFGKAVWLEEGNKRDFKYGYVMNAGLTGGAFDKAFSFKILTEESEIKIFSCSEKLIYDGETLIGSNSQNAYILPLQERYEPQVVRYKTNKDGEINFVDTASTGPKEDKETSLVKNLNHNATEYKSNAGYFWKTTPIDENTVVFVTPLYYATATEMIDNCDDSDFYTTKARQFGGMSAYSEGYDGSFVEPLGAMITYKMNRNDFQETSPVIYITDVSVSLDRKGNPAKKITGISKGQIVKLILNEEANEEFGDMMAVGDLWIYNLDLKNEVTFLVPLWSTDGTDYGSAYPLHTRPFDKINLAIMYAQSLDKHNGKYFEANVNGEACGFSFDNASVMVYDKQTGKINSILPENLITSKQAEEIGRKQYAFIYAYQKEVTQVIVVRE